jgi:UDP:flavonoid glycosyltransferase YjiC (YdhE family)
VEYPRSDAPKTLRFAGGYPDASQGSNPSRPAWWHEVTDNDGKHIVFVCQGTAATVLNHLVIPTMTAFRLHTRIIVVVALGKKGATLPPDVNVPSNCRVADYIPYDDMLPHCDVFITTGGYGAFQRALANGTPMVISGTTEDKPETAARAQWAGVGVNLQTSNPSAEQLRDAVDEVLGNERYKTRAVEIQAEMVKYDPMGVIIENIEELSGTSTHIWSRLRVLYLHHPRSVKKTGIVKLSSMGCVTCRI